MQLRVFADAGGELHLEISSPSLIYKRRLFVPMLPSSAAMLQGVDAKALVPVCHKEGLYMVPYLLLHFEETSLVGWQQIGEIEENDSRNVLNHILDIMAWD